MLSQPRGKKEIPPRDSLLRDARENHDQLPAPSKRKMKPDRQIERKAPDSIPTMKGDTIHDLMPKKRTQKTEPMPIKEFPDSISPSGK